MALASGLGLPNLNTVPAPMHGKYSNVYVMMTFYLRKLVQVQGNPVLLRLCNVETALGQFANPVAQPGGGTEGTCPRDWVRGALGGKEKRERKGK